MGMDPNNFFYDMYALVVLFGVYLLLTLALLRYCVKEKR